MNATEARKVLAALVANVEKIILGKTDVVRLSIIGLLAHGHILFEDVPGVGKTTLAQCLALSLGLSFQRIQFTSDLLPSDILGVTVYDPERREFEFREGPIFANIVLIDEINRTTPKTQSALLEAMNTAQVSIDRKTHDLPTPFIVMATQNPLEVHGTFPLPQSQLDRFMMRVHIGYPEAADESKILRDPRLATDFSALKPVVAREELIAMQSASNAIKIEDSLVDYMVRLVRATRELPQLDMGVSTRGALALRRSAQARAYIEGRDYCIPDDIKAMAIPTLAHRIVPVQTFDDGASGIGGGSEQIQSLLDVLEVPV